MTAATILTFVLKVLGAILLAIAGYWLITAIFSFIVIAIFFAVLIKMLRY